MMTATAKKATAKKAVAKKVSSPKATEEANASAAAAANQQVESDKTLGDKVPPVNTHEALNAVNPEGREGKPDTEVQEVEFIYPTHTDPNRRIPGPNPYLDDVDRERAEIVRARVEGREPDLDNPGSTAGTPLVSKDAFLAGAAPYTNVEGVKTVDLDVTVLKD